MPFLVLIVEKNLSTREDLARLFREQFREQFGDESDLVIAVSEPAEFDIAELREGHNLDLIVYKFPAEDFSQSQAVMLSALINRSLFRALYYKKTGNPFDDHNLSCHSGDIAVAVDEPDWDPQLAKKAKVFLCSQLVNGGLDALFNERDHRHPASPYEERFRRYFVHGRGLTHALSQLIGAITDFWNFLDERTKKRVEEQFCVDLDREREIGGRKYPIFVTLRRLPNRPS
mgnify:CR=1 FL=1